MFNVTFNEPIPIPTNSIQHYFLFDNRIFSVRYRYLPAYVYMTYLLSVITSYVIMHRSKYPMALKRPSYTFSVLNTWLCMWISFTCVRAKEFFKLSSCGQEPCYQLWSDYISARHPSQTYYWNSIARMFNCLSNVSYHGHGWQQSRPAYTLFNCFVTECLSARAQ